MEVRRSFRVELDIREPNLLERISGWREFILSIRQESTLVQQYQGQPAKVAQSLLGYLQNPKNNREGDAYVFSTAPRADRWITPEEEGLLRNICHSVAYSLQVAHDLRGDLQE